MKVRRLMLLSVCCSALGITGPASTAYAWTCESKCQWYQPDCLVYVAACETAIGACFGLAGAASEQVRLANGAGQPLTQFQKLRLRVFHGDLVDRVTVHYNAVLAGGLSIAGHTLNWGVDAQTFGHHIYVAGPFDEMATLQLGLLGHELKHVEQFERDASSGLNFLNGYCRGYVDAGFSYGGNVYEAQAFDYEMYIEQELAKGLPFGMEWSFAGPIPGRDCVQWLEPADPDTWNDNFLCFRNGAGAGVTWSSAGPVAGMRCTQITEGADPHTWNDNYLCVPSSSPLHFHWSSAGPVGEHCLRIMEPADPDTWDDNYLCVEPSFSMEWSSAGPIAGKSCVAWAEPSDPDTWDDNFLCFDQSYGVQWSSAGAIGGMRCTQILELSDPHTWDDNFLCVPNSSPLSFTWSSFGRPRDQCVRTVEPSDPDTWHDNYLCVGP